MYADKEMLDLDGMKRVNRNSKRHTGAAIVANTASSAQEPQHPQHSLHQLHPLDTNGYIHMYTYLEKYSGFLVQQVASLLFRTVPYRRGIMKRKDEKGCENDVENSVGVMKRGKDEDDK